MCGKVKRILSIVLLFASLPCMTVCGNEKQQGQTDADSSAIRKMEGDTVKKDSQSGKRPFDFEKKTVTLNSGYEIPLNGIGTYSLEDDTISSIAKAHGKSSAQVILRWNLQKGVGVIPGSSNPDHIQENMELYDFELTDEEMEKINALDRDEKHDWY